MTTLYNSPTREAIFQTVEPVAYALARGKDGMADSGLHLYRYIRDDETADTANLARDFYIAVRTRAEVIASQAGKPLKEQKTKSRDVQISKLDNFPTLGEAARDNANVDPAMDHAIRLCEGGYTKLVACAVAMKTELAKDIHATEDTLRAAIAEALKEKPAIASAEVAKVLLAFVKLAYGTDKEPAVFPLEFARLRNANTSDVAGTVKANLEWIVKTLEMAEEAKELAILAARVK